MGRCKESEYDRKKGYFRKTLQYNEQDSVIYAFPHSFGKMVENILIGYRFVSSFHSFSFENV